LTDSATYSPDPWQIACRSGALGATRPLAVTLEGRALVLFRHAGGVAALEDRCAHRNAPLSLGRVTRNGLECPYHGWRYDVTGTVAAQPALADPKALRAQPGIVSHPVFERDGFVWVAPQLAATAAAATVGGPPPRFPHLGQPGWTSFVLQTDFAAPVDACLENFLDVPHATFLHRYWFRAPTGRAVRARLRSLSDGAEVEFFDEPREKSLVWWLLAPRGGGLRHTDRYLAPRTSRVDYAFDGGLHYSITSSCSATSADQTRVYTVISFRHFLPGWLIRLFFEPLARRIIAQDARMLAAQYANIARHGGPAFVSTEVDLLGPRIQAWRRALAAGRTPLPEPERDVVIRI